MSEGLFSLRKLTKLEQQVADRARREELANCICRDGTIALPTNPEKFEAEMNLPCPAHGFRQLGGIMHFRVVHRDGTYEDSSRLDQLLATYWERRARQARLDLKDDDSEEP